jgi:hypothetical protein
MMCFIGKSYPRLCIPEERRDALAFEMHLLSPTTQHRRLYFKECIQFFNEINITLTIPYLFNL